MMFAELCFWFREFLGPLEPDRAEPGFTELKK
jgi:hypothetical protein